MTKKNYIAPEMAVCQVETQTFIAESQFETSGTPGSTQNVTPTSDPYSGEFKSRRHDIWEDEEEY